MTQNHICQFAVLSVVIKMRAAGGFNYEISLTWKRFGFYFLKKLPFQKSKRKNLCKMHSAFSNHLLLKGRATPESYKSEVKIRLPMKFDYLLTLIAWERVNLWVGLSPVIPMSLKQVWFSMFGFTLYNTPRVTPWCFPSKFWTYLSQIGDTCLSFPIIKSAR